MSNDKTDLMLKILENTREDVADVRREQASRRIRLAAIQERVTEATK